MGKLPHVKSSPLPTTQKIPTQTREVGMGGGFWANVGQSRKGDLHIAQGNRLLEPKVYALIYKLKFFCHAAKEECDFTECD